jgi:hypothetical protein
MIGCSLAVNKDGIIAQGEFNEFAGDMKVVEVILKPQQWRGTQWDERIKSKSK